MGAYFKMCIRVDLFESLRKQVKPNWQEGEEILAFSKDYKNNGLVQKITRLMQNQVNKSKKRFKNRNEGCGLPCV